MDAPSLDSAPTIRRVFSHRTFAMVWAGAFVSNIGNWMENSAQNWAVVHALKDNPAKQAMMSELLNFADFAPALGLVLIAGVITDRVNLKRYLLFLQLIACVLGSGLAVLAFMGLASPWVVIAFTFAEGIVWALNGPPWQTVVPHLVPRELLPRAISMNAAQFNLARLLGPFIAGALIVRYGVPIAFAINAVSFIVVIYTLLQIPPTSRKIVVTRPPIFEDLKGGLRYVWNHAGLRRLSLMLVCYSFFAAPLQGLLAVYVQTVLHGDASLYGNLLGCLGFGALVGALSVGYVPNFYPRHHLIPLAMCIAATCIATFSFVSITLLCGVILVGVGFFMLIFLNSTNAANQLLATDEFRGRVMSVMLLCGQGGLPLGHLAAAGLTHFLPAALVIRSMAVILVLISISFLLRREPAIDSMTRQNLRLTFLQSLWEGITAQSHRRVPQLLREEIATTSSNPADLSQGRT